MKLRLLFIITIISCFIASELKSQVTKITTIDTSITIKVGSSWAMIKGEFKEIVYPQGKGTISVKLHRNADLHVVYLSKSGYLTERYVIRPKKGFYESVYNLPYRNIIDLQHNTSLTKIYVDSINCPEGKIDSYIFEYSDYDQYLKKKPKKEKTFLNASIKEINFLYSGYRLETAVNHSLAKKGFIDTTETKLFDSRNDYKKVIGILKKMWYHDSNQMDMLITEMEWHLHDPISNSLFISKSVVDSTFWTINDSKIEVFKEAMSNSLNLFLQLKDVQKYLNNVKSESTELTQGWQILSVDTSSKGFSDINSLLSSTITIKTRRGHGSGCIISTSGIALTNYHVCGNTGTGSYVIFSNGDTCGFRVIRYNAYFDIALIQLNKPNGSSIKINTNKKIAIGSDVYAIGTPTNVALNQSVTKGIISSIRSQDNLDYIQSDVKVNPGSSGGALVNTSFELIGIVNSKMVGKGIEGLSFSIPSYNLEEALKLKFE